MSDYTDSMLEEIRAGIVTLVFQQQLMYDALVVLVGLTDAHKLRQLNDMHNRGETYMPNPWSQHVHSDNQDSQTDDIQDR